MQPHDIKRYTEANRAAWDEAAPVHERLNHEALLRGFGEPGFSTLDPHVLACVEAVGVKGKSVAQLCCNNGRELLSLKNMGAGRCVGFDASAAFIEQAHELARACGHDDVAFVVTDVYDIPSIHAARCDVVLITIGVLGWMPDLARFFDVVAGLMHPGAHLIIEETHPVLMMYEEGHGHDPSYLAHSYFHGEPWVETSGLDYYAHTKVESKPNYSFQHTLSEIMTCALDSGMALLRFTELDFDISGFCRDLGEADIRPPLGMTMVWRKG